MVKENLDNPADPPHDGATVDALHLKINNARRDTSWELAKKLRKKHTGAHPFSPKVKRTLVTILLWSKVIHYRSHRHRGSRQIRRLMRKLNITDAFHISIGEAVLRRKKL